MTRHDIPREPGRHDWNALLLVALVLAAATVLLVAGEMRPEYRRYQRQFATMVGDRSGADAADAVPRGIRQIWLPDLGRADRCVTCHQATSWRGFETAEQPFRTHPAAILETHPAARFGCTLCHGGQGWAVDTVRAHGHVRSWGEPLLDSALEQRHAGRSGSLALLEMACNTCHRYEAGTPGLERLNRAKRLITDKGCRACHRINGRGGLVGPDLTYEGDKNPEQFDYARLEGRPSVFAWQRAHLADPRALVPDTVMPNFHFTPDELDALAMLVMSWRAVSVPADLLGVLPKDDPVPEEERKLAVEMERGPGAWFVRTGCYQCHPVTVLGVRSPTPIGPDLSTAAIDTEQRFNRPIDEFIRNPVGTMKAVLARQFMLSPEEKETAIRELRSAYAAYRAQQTADAARRSP